MPPLLCGLNFAVFSGSKKTQKRSIAEAEETRKAAKEDLWGLQKPEAADSSARPLSQLPLWHLRRRGIDSQSDLLELLQQLHQGALPLPCFAASSAPRSTGAAVCSEGTCCSGGEAPSGYFEGAHRQGPPELELDLDLISWCPERLLEFGGEVGRLKKAWDTRLQQLLLRFGVQDEAALLSGLCDSEASPALRYMEGWQAKASSQKRCCALPHITSNVASFIASYISSYIGS